MAASKPVLNPQTLILIIVALGLASATTFAVMSDTSVRGLTVRIFNPFRTCTLDQSTDATVVTYSLTAVVYSTTSLRTTISQVQFRLSADGTELNTINTTDRAFDPGQGTSYSLVFSSPVIDPNGLKSTSNLTLTITAQVTAGIYSMKITASDSQTQNLGPSC